MPELPEVETVRRAITEAALGHSVMKVWASKEKMRWPIPPDIAARLRGHSICAVRRRGKYIVLDMAAGRSSGGQFSGLSMIVHLGMSGSVRIYPHDITPPSIKHDHLVITTAHHGGGITLVLNDPRRFGGVQLAAMGEEMHHPLLKNIGVEPLGNEMNAAMMAKAFRHKSVTIKAALLDQKIIAGIGNIYASEALFLAAISPRRLAKNISQKKCDDLAVSVRAVLEKAIEAGGTSLRDHVQPDGEIGYFAQQLNVYGRSDAPCPVCQKPIKMIRQAGRASFYCSVCQR
jgi:formamidopyrimidine-DNA glycosylase